MTVQTLYTAATGMEALETKLDVIANNMANINTTGFKKDRANFEDVFYRQYRLPGAEDADGNRTSTGIEVGLGTRVSSTQSNHEQGAFETTNNQLDFAIEGDGFFQVQNPNGGFLLHAGRQLRPQRERPARARLGEQRLRARAERSRFRRKRPISSSRPTGRCSISTQDSTDAANRSASCSWPSSSTPTAC